MSLQVKYSPVLSLAKQLNIQGLNVKLGINGVDSLSRIMSFILVCIGIQFVIIAIKRSYFKYRVILELYTKL